MRVWGRGLAAGLLALTVTIACATLVSAGGNPDLDLDTRFRHEGVQGSRTATRAGGLAPGAGTGAADEPVAGGVRRPAWDRWFGLGLLGAAAAATGAAVRRWVRGMPWAAAPAVFARAAAAGFLRTAAIGLGLVVAVAAAAALAPAAVPYLVVAAAAALAVGTGLAFMRRWRTATEAGLAPTPANVGKTSLAALGDLLGISPLIEGFTGRELLSGRRLSPAEAGAAFGSGAGMVCTWVVGGQVATVVHNRVAAAAPVVQPAMRAWQTMLTLRRTQLLGKQVGTVVDDAEATATTLIRPEPRSTGNGLRSGVSEARTGKGFGTHAHQADLSGEVAPELLASDHDIVAAAVANQTHGGRYYADVWEPVILPEGTIVIGGAPGQSHFYTTLDTLVASGNKRAAFFQAVQVAPHPKYGYRPGVTVYEVVHNVKVAAGVARANPQFGSGGAKQYWFPVYDETVLRPRYSIILKED